MDQFSGSRPLDLLDHPDLVGGYTSMVTVHGRSSA